MQVVALVNQKLLGLNPVSVQVPQFLGSFYLIKSFCDHLAASSFLFLHPVIEQWLNNR